MTQVPLRIGIGGPVGSGKTALVESLCRRLQPQYDLARLQDMNQMTRRGSGWANFDKGSLQSSASFADSGRNCIAVERLGPPWHGGYVWVVHASVCAAAGGVVQNDDIDAMFAMLQLRTYDAQSNLRAQLQ